MILARFTVLIVFIFSCSFCLAQTSFTIHGYVKDSATGEALSNAHIILKKINKGAVSNRYGFFSLSLPQNEYTLLVSVVGYRTKNLTIMLTQDIEQNISLIPMTYQLNEVVVEEKSNSINIDATSNAYTINPVKIKEFPRLGGEPDMLKVLQTLPGVQQGNEGSAGLHVRGGSPDQNLILVDGVPVYNVFHLFGFLSVFNTDAVKDIKIYKDGIPSYYEGRLSSVVDISLKEGNLKNKKGTLSISPVAGSFTYETPIKKDKSSIAISGRRTWLDAIMLLLNEYENKTAFNFYDLSAKYYTKINEKNNVYLSYYSSRDKFFSKSNGDDEKTLYSFNWQNHTGLLRWNRVIGNKAFLNNSLSLSHYSFNQIDRYKGNNTEHIRNVRSFIRDINLTSTIDLFPNTDYDLTLGASISHQNFQPEILQAVNNDSILEQTAETKEKRINGNVFIHSNLNITDRLNVRGGLRLTWLSSTKDFYFQPRLAANYEISSGIFIRAAYDRLAQTLHLLTNTSIGQPTDLWVPANNVAPVELSSQYSLGFQKAWMRSGIKIDVTGYIKNSENLIEYKEGTNFLFGIRQNWTDKIVVGTGDSEGVELLLSKDKGRINGWMSYTLSKATRRFDEINAGFPFPYKYDRRHNFSITAFYDITKNKKLSMFFTFNSGHAFTLPTATMKTALPPGGEYYIGGYADVNEIGYIDSRNNLRMPDYHRLDIAYQTSKQKTKCRRTWIFSIYNIYNKLNPYFIYQREGRLKQYVLFPVIPSITYRLEF